MINVNKEEHKSSFNFGRVLLCITCARQKLRGMHYLSFSSGAIVSRQVPRSAQNYAKS